MLSDELDKVDAVGVLAAAAGLQLEDHNIHHLYRLERLAALAARHKSTSPRRLSTNAIRRILRTPEVGNAAIMQQEDEFEGFVTVEVPFFGTTYLVLQGLLTDSALVARNLLAAVFTPREPALPIEFIQRVHWAADLLLSTSAALAEQNRLERYATAPQRDREIKVPSMATIEELARRVTFDEAELLDRFTAEAADYLRSALFADATALPPWNGDDDVDEAIVATPFLRTSRGIMVAAPFELMATLRHLIGIEAVNHSCAAILTEKASDFAAHVVTELFGHICDDDFEEAEHSSPHLRVYRARFDRDKVLDLRIRVEPFDNYDPGTIFQPPVVQRGASEVESVDHPVDKTLVVDVVWSHGSGVHSFAEADGGLYLAGPYSTFETILFSSGTHNLTLWYFAQALERWSSAEGGMFMGSTLDAYAIYEGGDEQSFYASDDGVPTAMFIVPGSGEELRRTVAERTGKTYVHDMTRNRTHEAILVHGTATTVRHVIAPGCLYYAELPTGTVRVNASVSPEAKSAPVSAIAEGACFWLYTLGIEVPELLVAQSQHDIQVSINFTAWEATPAGSPDSWITHSINEPTGVIELTVPTPPVIDRHEPPNVLDRALVRTLIQALKSAAPDAPDIDPTEILDTIVPPGERRMLHVADYNADLVTWPGRLPHPRKVMTAVTAMLLDELGAYLSDERGRGVGPIPDDQRTAVLNKDVVPFFGDRLSDLLTGHNDRELLRYLILANEALLREAHIDRKKLPSRIACFGRHSDQVERFAKNMTASPTAAVSSRFLIEYVSGNPCAGDLPPTAERYDLMLALAAEVTNKGFLSEAIHAEISTASVSMLPSGRFGIARDEDRWVTGLQGFLRSHASTTVDTIAQAAVAGVPQQEQTDEPYDLTKHDSVAEAEFGFTFTDLKSFIGKLLDISIEQDQHDVGDLPVTMVRSEMIDTFGWDVAKFERLIGALSMGPESNFWKLGTKVHPWRYNRERSYLRKPLILRNWTDGDSIVFGHRNTYLAPLHWYGQYDSGRLQARSPEMKKALSEAVNRKGDSFEIQVEATLKRECAPVRRRVRKIGQHDLRNINGRDLGDIDLVAYHPPSRTLLLIEAKALETARTPSELRNEIANILEGDHSAVTRLRGRYEWALKHIDALRNEFGLPSGRLILTPMIVIDDDLVTRELNSSDFPIVPLDRLLERINGKPPARRNGKRAGLGNRHS